LNGMTLPLSRSTESIASLDEYQPNLAERRTVLAPGSALSRSSSMNVPVVAFRPRRLCDAVVDRLSRIPGSACVLGDFVPYTR
jgi:hypothetical protein